MELSRIQKEWTIAQTSRSGAQRLWADFAKSKKNPTVPKLGEDMMLNLVESEKMITEKSVVLDLGCGTGRYSQWFAERCSFVAGIDLSPEAIGIAQEKAANSKTNNVQFICDNWHDGVLDKYDWENKFDLVFCNMSPAVQSYNSFSDLCRASRAWCVMSKPTCRQEHITKYLLNELCLPDVHRPFEDDMQYAFNVLSSKGIHAKRYFEETSWERDRSVDDAVEHYTAWLITNFGLQENQESDVRFALEKISENGIIHDNDSLVISVLYWHV